MNHESHSDKMIIEALIMELERTLHSDFPSDMADKVVNRVTKILRAML